MSEIKKAHSFCYENGAVNLTGVKEVKSFTDREVVLTLEDSGLVVKGEGLSVSELDTSTGIVRVTGTLNHIGYTRAAEPISFLKRLLK